MTGQDERGDEQVKIIADAWMLHQGYTQEEIEASVNDLDHSLCEMIPGVGWDCMDEDGSNRHPEYVALCEASEMANVALDALAQAGFHLTPTAEVKAEALSADLVQQMADEARRRSVSLVDSGVGTDATVNNLLGQAQAFELIATHLRENGGA